MFKVKTNYNMKESEQLEDNKLIMIPLSFPKSEQINPWF